MRGTRHPRDPAIAPIDFEIYCRVVDNLGDAGVCWRLARQLALEHGAAVTLRIDAPRTLAAIVPAARVGETVDGVAIRDWERADIPERPRTVLVSAFGCELPAAVRTALAHAPQVAWINLEYLSAEPWIDGCHGLASPKPDDGAVEHFFYPGFTASSGGLLRERGLIDARDAFRSDAGALRWLRARGFDARENELRISLFCYRGAPLREWLDALARDPQPTHLLVPAGVAGGALDEALGAPLAAGASVRIGALRIEAFGLLAQPDYDRLLWSCGVNFVRGEDSWIRAIWAASPLVWQPYRQSADAHVLKLEAFLDRFREAGEREAPESPAPIRPGAASRAGGMPREARPAIDAAAAMMRAWNSGKDAAAAWAAYRRALAPIGAAHARWTAELAATTDLATRLVEFCDSRL